MFVLQSRTLILATEVTSRYAFTEFRLGAPAWELPRRPHACRDMALHCSFSQRQGGNPPQKQLSSCCFHVIHKFRPLVFPQASYICVRLSLEPRLRLDVKLFPVKSQSYLPVSRVWGFRATGTPVPGRFIYVVSGNVVILRLRNSRVYSRLQV
jgi:hypothetical protein